MIGNLGPWAVILTLFFTHVRIIIPDKRFRNNQPLAYGTDVGTDVVRPTRWLLFTVRSATTISHRGLASYGINSEFRFH